MAATATASSLVCLTSKTATTAARIFSRLDSVEEVQRGRSGSAVGITPPGGPGVAGAAGGAAGGAGSGAVAATAVAAGSPARSGHQQQQFGVAAIRQRSASTVLDIGLQQRKVSVGSGVGVVGGVGAAAGPGAGPPSPGILHKRTGFNGFGGYEAPVIPNRQDILNGPGVGVGGTASSVGLAAAHRHHHPHRQYLERQQQHQRQQEDQQRQELPSGRQQVDRHPASVAAQLRTHHCPCRGQSDRAASRMSSPS
nr:fibroin heavy chain-like [Drosophila kikkawai]